MPDTDKQLHTGPLDYEEFIEFVVNSGHKLDYPLATNSLLLAATFVTVQSEFEDGYGSVQDLPYLEKYGLLSSRIIQSEEEIENESLGDDAQVGEPYYQTTYLGYMFGEIAPSYLQEQLDKFNGVNALASLNPDGVAELVAASEEMLKQACHFMFADNPQYKALETALANVKGGV